MDNIKEAIAEYMKAQEFLKNNLRAEGEKYVTSLVEDIMNANPEVKGLVWRGYAPYFNDGDACEFSIRGVGVHGDPVEDEYTVDESDYFLKTWGEEAYYDSTLASKYSGNWDYTYIRESKTYDNLWKGDPSLKEDAERLKALERQIEKEIFSREDILEMALGNPHEVKAWRKDGKLHIEISFEVDHD